MRRTIRRQSARWTVAVVSATTLVWLASSAQAAPLTPASPAGGAAPLATAGIQLASPAGTGASDDASAAGLTDRPPSLGFEVLYPSRLPVARANARHDQASARAGSASRATMAVSNARSSSGAEAARSPSGRPLRTRTCVLGLPRPRKR